MRVIQYPETMVKEPVVFLGGSTAKGDWQKLVQDAMSDTMAAFINTSRPDWDVTEPTREEKNDHIEWEFEWLNRSLIQFIGIPENASKSPTVLLELGIAISKPLRAAVVYIHPSYSHFENARIACDEVGVRVYTDFEEAVKRLKDLYLNSFYLR